MFLLGDKENSAYPASIRWTAPEIFRHPSADEESGLFNTMCDVFSFGMLMWELLIQADPFYDIEDEAHVCRNRIHLGGKGFGVLGRGDLVFLGGGGGGVLFTSIL